ncbi:hypothetical protein ES332_A05G177700v1 [Gossypium tomentosum]|uniref:Uncharacterized protein n=1 Tax=Gossypium tomentosum TaxID=34277 RepID=A0A5D2QH09_GOSTO|nr:hypothetical protein ES332_A05G177700v1 [Gossypium tomentosum]
MGQEKSYFYSWSPVGAPLNVQREEDHWRHADNSVNAVSFGFVATAILISMFLVMAIFERFLKPNTSPGPGGGRNHADLQPQLSFNGKPRHPSPKMTIYTSGVSVLMPGDVIPTSIAICTPCPHQHHSSVNPNSDSSVNINAS